MSRRNTEPKLTEAARPFSVAGNLTDKQRFAKAIARARETKNAIVVAWIELNGERVGWIQSTISLDNWAFTPVIPRKRGTHGVQDPYLAQILPKWAQDGRLDEIFIDPIDLRGKKEIAREMRLRQLEAEID